MDGTLADVRSIRHYVEGEGKRDFDSFHKASRFVPPNKEAVALTRSLAPDVAPLVVTARDARYERETRDWLAKHEVPHERLYMRPWGDQRKDAHVKQDILDQIRSEGYAPRMAVDDNPNVLEVWERNDIPVVRIPGWNDG